MELVAVARRVNDGQVGVAVERLRAELGSLHGVPVLVLGLTYREGVKELAYSRGPALVTELAAAGAMVRAWDPLLDAFEIAALGADPWTWGRPDDARAIVTQTADAAFREIDLSWFPDLRVVLDGRAGLGDVELPPRARLLGIGRPPRGSQRAGAG